MSKNTYIVNQDDNDSEEGFIPIITEIEMNNDFDNLELPSGTIPVLALRNMVLFPTVVLPVQVGRQKSLKLIKEAAAKKKLIGVFSQFHDEVEDPDEKDLYPIGVLAEVVRVFEMPDRSTTVVLHGKKKISLGSLVKTEPYLEAHYTLLEEEIIEKDDSEFDALVSTVKEMTVRLIKMQSELPREAINAIKGFDAPMQMIHFICSNLPVGIDEKLQLLMISNVKNRIFKLIKVLSREIQLQEIKSNIQLRAREDLNQQQREYFLQQQIKTIQEELGGSTNDQDFNEFADKARRKKWNKKVQEVFEKELRKLERLNPQSPDYSVQANYLQVMLSLPWEEYTKDKFDIPRARKVLDKDHFGMEKVKERILEHLAVLQLKGDMKSPILCLYGPPGVGKTSLGKSIAEALKRNYCRISLGGLHDEAEIRGHRRTYIGAMPGRIIQNLQKIGSSNPVFILDEIDKMGMGHKGDPSSALLEVLDPEQNNTFHDNFLDIDYDLSKVMFIATANNIADIPRPLLDRMELIEISGYILQEKVEIAKRHLLAKQLETHGLPKKWVKASNAVLENIVDNYTRESGVRELDKKLGKVMRKLAVKKVETVMSDSAITLSQKDVEELLGTPEYTRDKYQDNNYAGVVTGLAWTAVGGEILFVESSLSKGKGSKLTLTGNLGDVMKESAMLAMEYIKAHASDFNLTDEVFEKWNVHIHVPEGAIPKDGPSAGVTMITSLVSSFTQRKVKPFLAMTGEITLRGKVLPVGGIKEKILAAKRSGIKEIILCHENMRHILEIPQQYLDGLTFHYVKDVKEVLNLALMNEKVKDALTVE